MILKSQCPMDSDIDAYAKVTSNLLEKELIPKTGVPLIDVIKNSLEAIRIANRDIDIGKHADQYLLVSILSNFEMK